MADVATMPMQSIFANEARRKGPRGGIEVGGILRVA